ncbi:MAG: Eco57I restriction-modification methylase domain-containing protein, partial [Pirellulaceae bacterium]
MAPLPSNLCRDLERTIITARDVAEVGARAALEALTVHEGKPGSHLPTEQRELRNRLRAHGRQLGDQRNEKSKAQAIDHLIQECAYEHWHRMIFARFLAENDLLVEPESGVSVTLEEVEELARDAGVDPWELASRFAKRMLPQIFRPDDPVLAVPLPTETRLELESLLESLPAAVFTADDSLGWVYQFWQSKKKDEVNASGEKITGDTLPAVTQLFTEHYMVLFLLHNTVGAWWAGKRLKDEGGRMKAEWETCRTEGDCRRLVALPGVDWEYLRFVKEEGENEQPERSSFILHPSSFRPAAGTFDGWPRTAAELKVLDPCCGSGHFLVAVFELLTRLRMDEEGLSAEDAARAVLRDNIFGLEIDPRCTQIAAFALAFAAWKMAGRVIDLPPLNIACSGIGPSATLDEWLELAEKAEHTLPRHAREPVRNGLENLHRLFSQAPVLGSLIDPTELPSDMFAADYETLQPFLEEVFEREAADVEARERAVAAQGMAKAADILGGDYHLVITNVPYLGWRKQDEILKSHLEERYTAGKADLATALVLRCLNLCSRHGTIALVTPQNWLFLTSYKKLRESLLQRRTWNLVARLGPGAFDTISGHVVKAVLLALSVTKPTDAATMAGIDVSEAKTATEKAARLIDQNSTPMVVVRQRNQMRNPDARVAIESQTDSALLQDVATATAGMLTGDGNRFIYFFWEPSALAPDWESLQSTVTRRQLYGGRSHVVYWQDGTGDLFAYAESVKHLNTAVQRWRTGQEVWGRNGIVVNCMGELECTIYLGDRYDNNVGVICPKEKSLLPAIWAYCSSPAFKSATRRIDQKVNVTAATFAKVPFDLDHWQKVAAEKYPNGLPEPESDDPAQWLFHGWPVVKEPAAGAEPLDPPDFQRDAVATLQVAVARLLGYRWPAELDDEMRLSERARDLVHRCDELLEHTDPDGIVCLPAVRAEGTAAERLRRMLAAACGNEWSADKEAVLLAAAECEGTSLDQWLRDKFFEQHCKLFHHRPFIWHIWDGRKDGFHALVNYHKLAAPSGAGRKLLETLTYSYLGDWITRQQHGVKQDEPGAEARLAAAEDNAAEIAAAT